jgi:hypothetical protein
MTDESAGIVGVSIIFIIILFIGWWFGWKPALWIMIIATGVISAFGFLSTRK